MAQRSTRQVNATRVADLRRGRPLTQAALAHASGITQAYLSQIESGTRSRVRVDVLERIAGVLDVSVETITAEVSPIEDVLTVAEAASALRLNEQTVRGKCRSGEIPAAVVSGQYRIPARVIAELLTPTERAS